MRRPAYRQLCELGFYCLILDHIYRGSSSFGIHTLQKPQTIMYSLLVTMLAAFASAKTMTYNFDIGWVTVSLFQDKAVQIVVDQYRQHQMATPDKSSVSMENGRKLHLSHL